MSSKHDTINMAVTDTDASFEREAKPTRSDHCQTPRRRRYAPRYTHLAHHSQPIRWLATAVLLLPPLLYLICFAVTMSVMQTPDFVAADRLLYDNINLTSTPLPGKVSHASPWYQCSAGLGNATDLTTFEETCVRRPATGQKGLDACNALNTGGPNVKICVKITQTAELYTAGAALSGCAFLVAAFYGAMASVSTGVGPGYSRVPGTEAEGERRHGHHDSLDNPRAMTVANNAVGSLATLLALAAAACLVMGQVLGYASMVVESSIDINPITNETRWYMSKGILDYTSAAYGLSLIGAFVALTACGLHR